MPEIPQLSKKKHDWGKIGPESLTAALYWDRIAPGETFERVEEKHLQGQHDQSTHGHRGAVSVDIEEYMYSREARTLPRDYDNRIDGGPGPSIQYHGTSARGIEKFNTDEVYLTNSPNEAAGYARGQHRMDNKRGGEILSVRRKPGKTINISDAIEKGMQDGDDPDDIIAAFLAPARNRGYRYIYFEHPAFDGGTQRVVISLHPQSDLSIVSRARGKDRP